MPHAHGFEFDQVVLDMIDHDPHGIVPSTPTHQDALNRLCATHQVYASADHKGGYVTARSLIAQASFHAANLPAVMDGLLPVESLEANAAVYGRYVESLPAAFRARAETFRLRVAGRPVHHRPKLVGEVKTIVAHDPVHTLFLVPGCGPHSGLPGNYLYGSAMETGPHGSAHHWAVQLHDCDDGVAVCDVPSMQEAFARLIELEASAPFHLNELEALGFRLV